MSRRLWVHKHELFIEGGGYSYLSSVHRTCWTDRMIPTSSNSITTSGTRTATVRLCVRKAVCKNIWNWITLSSNTMALKTLSVICLLILRASIFSQLRQQTLMCLRTLCVTRLIAKRLQFQAHITSANVGWRHKSGKCAKSCARRSVWWCSQRRGGAGIGLRM